jgi:hypothetical protein
LLLTRRVSLSSVTLEPAPAGAQRVDQILGNSAQFEAARHDGDAVTNDIGERPGRARIVILSGLYLA